MYKYFNIQENLTFRLTTKNNLFDPRANNRPTKSLKKTAKSIPGPLYNTVYFHQRGYMLPSQSNPAPPSPPLPLPDFTKESVRGECV